MESILNILMVLLSLNLVSQVLLFFRIIKKTLISWNGLMVIAIAYCVATVVVVFVVNKGESTYISATTINMAIISLSLFIRADYELHKELES